MDEGKRDVRFVRSYWTSIGNPGIWATVLRDCRCYVLDVDVDVEEKGKPGRGNQDKHLGSSNFRDALKTGGLHGGSSRGPDEWRSGSVTSRLSLAQRQTQPQIQQSNTSGITNTGTSTASQQGLRLSGRFRLANHAYVIHGHSDLEQRSHSGRNQNTASRAR